MDSWNYKDCPVCGGVVSVSNTQKHQDFHDSVQEVRDAVWKTGGLSE